jgi:probable F420-dependent oxidoreductase
VRFNIALPGQNHIPPVDDHIIPAPQWSVELAAPDFQRIAAAVDAGGYHGIMISEHLAMPHFEVPRLGPYWMDALSAIAFVAGSTRRVRVTTSVLVVPYHHPLALAKTLSTIDVLSGGRLDIAAGIGHAVREFEVLGIPFGERGAITDETLQAMIELWSSDQPSFDGHYFQINGLAFEPKPVQRPRPPIYIGGNSKPALRRAARYDGWEPNPRSFTVEEVPPLLDYIRSQPGFSGQERTFQVRWPGTIAGLERPAFAALSGSGRASYADQITERLAYLAGLGITSVTVPVPVTDSLGEYLDFVRWFDAEIVARPA